jgi:hypothetical protein
MSSPWLYISTQEVILAQFSRCISFEASHYVFGLRGSAHHRMNMICADVNRIKNIGSVVADFSNGGLDNPSFGPIEQNGWSLEFGLLLV